MVVLVKEFDTAKLLMIEMQCSGEDHWSSADGEYTTTIPKAEFESGGTVLVRVNKK